MLNFQHLPLIALAATLTASAQVSRDTVFLRTLSFPARVGNGWMEAIVSRAARMAAVLPSRPETLIMTSRTAVRSAHRPRRAASE
jgi:hypothetical protein